MAKTPRFLLVVAFAALPLATAPSYAEESVDFSGKSVTVIIGSAPGGGTDAVGRMVAHFLGKHLPGQPNVTVRNVPGADGITVLNYVVEQTKADGLTVVTGAAPQLDAITYRAVSNLRYYPAERAVVGGGLHPGLRAG